MDLTPHSQLQQWLVLTLGKVGGGASRASALDAIEETFGHLLTTDDQAPPPSRPFETKWRNRVSWQRDKMVKAGLLEPFRGHGTPWELTPAGWAEYRELTAAVPEGAGNPFANFKPKSSADYISRVRARVQTKSRAHERLVKEFGLHAMTRGFVPDTNVHPRDLLLDGKGETWLVEAKVLYLGNATAAVRAALAQTLMYRFLLHRPPLPSLLAVFSEPIGAAYVTFLEAHDVASVWQASDRWGSSDSAVVFRT